MGNSPCCCKDDNPDIEVKVKDVYCCDNTQSSCCIKAEKKHHHKHHSKHNQLPNQHH
jgi:hypothetical protein